MTNTPSYQKVNYSLRPAKNIERKMIGEACTRLNVFRPITDYRYIGFGSPFFSDFRLFHKMFGFTNMINIESQFEDQARFEFNKPFGCINIIHGNSGTVLSGLDWEDLPTVIWLDYDKRFSASNLDDIALVTANVANFSMMVVTIEAKASKFGEGRGKLDTFNETIGPYFPMGVGQGDLAETRYPSTLVSLSNGVIADTLVRRNAVAQSDDELDYKQLFNFHYDDGTPMVSFGGIFVERRYDEQFAKCRFSDFTFYRPHKTPYLIKPPLLTFNEQRHLDAQLPGDGACASGISQEDVTSYGEIYRYFPSFTEIEL